MLINNHDSFEHNFILLVAVREHKALTPSTNGLTTTPASIILTGSFATTSQLITSVACETTSVISQ